MLKRKSNQVVRFPEVFIELTNHCNFHCWYCPSDMMQREKGFMEISLAKRILDSLAEHEITEKIYFHLMGEPLLYPNLEEVCSYAKKKGFTVDFATNGALLSKRKAEGLFNAGVDAIGISNHPASEESFTLLRPRAHVDFQTYTARIRSAIESKVETKAQTEIWIAVMITTRASLLGYDKNKVHVINTPVEAHNILQEWFKFANKLRKKIGLFPLNPLEPQEINLKRFSFELLPGVHIFGALIHPWGVMEGKRKIPALVGACPGLQKQFGILWNGDIVMCCEDFDGRTRLGNVKKDSLADILNSKYTRRCKRLLQFCIPPTPFCRQCRGGTTIKSWFATQLGSIAVHKFHIAL